ncbi:MAG: YkuS family protein [Clostridia bacterium]|nr:YkuS family protein [Clostridia bacterium]
MKISVEKGLENISYYLTQKGYEIVPEDSVADAYIYENTPISSIPSANFSPVSSLAENPILLICAKNRSFDEIEMTLKQKAYNKLF